jgi:hypothetical protein
MIGNRTGRPPGWAINLLLAPIVATLGLPPALRFVSRKGLASARKTPYFFAADKRLAVGGFVVA